MDLVIDQDWVLEDSDTFYKLVYNPHEYYRYNPLINPSYWTYKPS